MDIHIELQIRAFDGRSVYRWTVSDAAGVRGAGCELTRRRAMQKAQEFRNAVVPERLLAMLECQLRDEM